MFAAYCFSVEVDIEKEVLGGLLPIPFRLDLCPCGLSGESLAPALFVGSFSGGSNDTGFASHRNQNLNAVSPQEIRT